MKTCPWCAESIQDAAIVCKHCGRDVGRPAAVTTRACPFCDKQIPLAARICPSCGDDVSGTIEPAPADSISAQAQLAAPGVSQSTQVGVGCAVVLLLLMGGCWWTLTPSSSPEAQRKRAEDDARIKVSVLCEEGVRQRLKAPGTAEFPFANATNVQALGNSRYRMQSWVDAQNAFGAKLRNNFVCVVEGSGDSAGYKLVELSGLD